MCRHQREDAQDRRRVAELRAGKNIDATLVENEVGAGDRCAASTELAVEADRRRQVLHQKCGAAIDDARMSVVGPHPVSRVGSASCFKPDGVGCGFVLRLPVERVVVAPMAEMKETSCGGKEIKCSLCVSAGALEDSAALAGPLLGLFEMKKESKPDGKVVIAQAARTFLQIWFEMEDGVAVLGVAGACNFAQLLRNGVPLAQNQAREDRLMKLLVKGELAGEEAAVECGECKFQVIRIELASFLHRPRAWTGPKADIPHALNDRSNGFPGLFLSFLVGEGEEHIDIGIGEEIFASVAAQSE